MTWWDPYVETSSIADEGTYLRRKFHQDVTDKTTGLSQEALPARLAEIVAAGKAAGEDWRVTKATCPGRAFKIHGREWTIPQIVAKALEDKPFYDASGGGVTISGGEPLFFPEWTTALLFCLTQRTQSSQRLFHTAKFLCVLCVLCVKNLFNFSSFNLL